MDYSRRQILKAIGAGSALTWVSLNNARFAFAQTAGDKRLMVVILRGAMDGLGAIIPYADPAYAAARGALAMPQSADALVDLNGYFAMHSALAPLAALYQQKQMLIMHAVATPYRERSHFDAQNLLEIGSNQPHALKTGWLNRVLLAMPRTTEAVALGTSIPLILRGNASIGSWAPETLADVPEEMLSRIMHMYQSDPPLLNSLMQAAEMQMVGTDIKVGQGNRNFADLMRKAASFMQGDKGATIATVDLGGWDTHAGQGLESGRLANALKLLADGLIAYQQGMGADWDKTAVLVVTEFGRTVRANGTGGSDHGTASVAFLLGGNVAGGRIAGDWPTLAKLYQDRDLTPANDLRAFLKATLHQHLGIDGTQLDESIFPQSSQVQLREKLFNPNV